MGRNQQNDNPTDMSSPIEKPPYSPPDRSACEIPLDMPIEIDDEHWVYVEQRVYRGLTVWFALMQYFNENDHKYEITRIDCCHSEIHQHMFFRRGDEQRTVIEEIDASGAAWETVDRNYEPCLDRIMGEGNPHLENHRRWNRG